MRIVIPRVYGIVLSVLEWQTILTKQTNQEKQHKQLLWMHGGGGLTEGPPGGY